MDETSSTDRARRVWDRSAPSYDRQIGFLERHWFRGGREWLGARARGRLLDVGVGTGRNLPHYGADVAVAGIDVSPAMLAIARQRAADLGRTVDLREGDAEHLPWPDDSFDTVVSALVLCTIANRQAAIAEMRRVLTPGGRLLLLDHVASTVAPLRAAQWLFERFTIAAAGSTSPAVSCPWCGPPDSRSSRRPAAGPAPSNESTPSGPAAACSRRMGRLIRPIDTAAAHRFDGHRYQPSEGRP